MRVSMYLDLLLLLEVAVKLVYHIQHMLRRKLPWSPLSPKFRGILLFLYVHRERRYVYMVSNREGASEK
jgi:hypothetical protein